jgi:Domain of unknown function (DUF4926)
MSADMYLKRVVYIGPEDVRNGLRFGDVGTVVEPLEGKFYLVEFSNEAGETRVLTTLDPQFIRQLREDEDWAWVSVVKH